VAPAFGVQPFFFSISREFSPEIEEKKYCANSKKKKSFRDKKTNHQISSVKMHVTLSKQR
jgi:hypothetical protein